MPIPPTPPDPDVLAQAVLTRLAERRPGATICPSEVARALATDALAWRALMPAIRDAARSLARDGRLRVTQRGRSLDPQAPWHGPIRLAAAGGSDAAGGAQVTAGTGADGAGTVDPPPAGDPGPTDRARGPQVAPPPADPQR